MPILSKPLNFFCLLLIAITLRAEEPPSMPSLRGLVDAEKSFAHASLEHGIRESFLQFLTDDSIVFDPAPTNGKKLYANYDDKGRSLIWQPVFASISNAGDIGFTTGPWELKKSATDSTSIAFGQFVSIWKRQPDSSWKVIVDGGIDHPQPAEPPGETQLLPPSNTLLHVDVDLERRSLNKAEKIFGDELKRDVGGAIVKAAADEVRVFRENSFPAIGKTAAKLMLSSDHGKMTRKTSGGGMSASADLAYRYGLYSTERGNVKERGYFLSIWKLDLNREWRIIGDVQKKAAPEKK